MTVTLPLDPRLTVDAAAALWSRLRQDGAVTLDASGVRHLGAAGLQVLLVADAKGGLQLAQPSPAMVQAISDMGATGLLGGAA